MTKLLGCAAFFICFFGVTVPGLACGINENISHDRSKLFGFSTGAFVPFMYALASGKSFDNTSLYSFDSMPGNGALAARIAVGLVVGATVANAIATSFFPSADEQESLPNCFLRRERDMGSIVGRSLLGPAICFLLNDHYWLPFASSILFSALDGKSHTATWYHQAGIVTGAFAGRITNQIIALFVRQGAESVAAV